MSQTGLKNNTDLDSLGATIPQPRGEGVPQLGAAEVSSVSVLLARLQLLMDCLAAFTHVNINFIKSSVY